MVSTVLSDYMKAKRNRETYTGNQSTLLPRTEETDDDDDDDDDDLSDGAIAGIVIAAVVVVIIIVVVVCIIIFISCYMYRKRKGITTGSLL